MKCNYFLGMNYHGNLLFFYYVILSCIGWLGLRVGGRLVLPYIRQMNRVNSRSDFVTMTAPWTSSSYYYYYYYYLFVVNQITDSKTTTSSERPAPEWPGGAGNVSDHWCGSLPSTDPLALWSLSSTTDGADFCIITQTVTKSCKKEKCR